MGTGILVVILCSLAALVLYDVTQRQHTILHNFPLIGHLRYLLEMIGPELRQYIVTSNDEERPFSRDQRSWIYASAKQENNYFGFGSDNDMENTSTYIIVKHNPFPLTEPHAGGPGYDPHYTLPCAKVLGGHRKRAKAFRPRSIINASGMSYGSLSHAAVEAINRGAILAGCMQSTGEGGVSPYHLHGADLIWQIGTGYFGCRDEHGRFSLSALLERIEKSPHIKALEIKLSQGAKPGLGGVLPAAKITPEIAAIRGVPMGQDCISPSAHTAFCDVDSMLDFVEMLAEKTGLPIGIKSAVGNFEFWRDLGSRMANEERAVDFITIDGGEGGTGAAPLFFADHVALPFKVAFAKVYKILAEYGVHEDVVMIGSGKLGLPANATLAFALGCDLIAVGREAMLAIGCIQAQRCHTGHCPTGVATNNPWLVRGLDPTLKASRFANYIITMRKELTRISLACGVLHPGLLTLDQIEILDGQYGSNPARDIFGYAPGLGRPKTADCEQITALLRVAHASRCRVGEDAGWEGTDTSTHRTL